MPALVAGIHVSLRPPPYPPPQAGEGREGEGVDGQDKPGHDDAEPLVLGSALCSVRISSPRSRVPPSSSPARLRPATFLGLRRVSRTHSSGFSPFCPSSRRRVQGFGTNGNLP